MVMRRTFGLPAGAGGLEPPHPPTRKQSAQSHGTQSLTEVTQRFAELFWYVGRLVATSPVPATFTRSLRVTLRTLRGPLRPVPPRPPSSPRSLPRSRGSRVRRATGRRVSQRSRRGSQSYFGMSDGLWQRRPDQQRSPGRSA